jgi:hypothetical protein
MLLFDREANQAPPASAKLFGLLVYGGPHKEALPSLAQILFPTPTGSIACDGIDLLAEHPEIAAQYAPATEESSQPRPKLRKKPGEAEG